MTPDTATVYDREVSNQRHKKDVFAQQPYIACGSCNGGWMKNFEDEVLTFIKPILLGVFTGALTKNQERTLCGWISLIVLLQELKSFTQNTIVNSDLGWLRKNRVPPSNWSIFIAHSAGPIWSRHYQYHNFGMYAEASKMERTTEGLPIYNTQLTTMGVGCLFIQVFSSPLPEVVSDFRRHSVASGLTKLWPSPYSPRKRITFPLTLRLMDDEAFAVEASSYQLIRSG